ncbi:MAG: serine/threonine-protein kinase [Coriobacteriales bacterium]|nr:serine/threonine-protein kinase [Coriobacteriales bacterium]
MQQTTGTRQGAINTYPNDPTEVMLGRYRILETNTEGGFGTVSVCWDSRLQRRVAIKRMPLRLESDSPVLASTLDEALAEARTSSLLAHPNIVRMYDFESDASFSYLVMEYVDGLNLADLLARVEGGVLTFDECAHLVDSVASALAFAHENGVLHLDLKPANIIIDRTGTVKLGDFGMASLASAAGYGGARGGTIGYMPPEQIEGGYVDERTDVFSLAVVVWEALTGSCPYAANTPEESLKLIEHGPSPALSRIEPELAGIVEETLLRALDPNPASRMVSIEEFARDLVRALGDAADGRESLQDLLNQTEERDEPNPAEDWGRLHVPMRMQFPWLGSAVTRILAAATAAWTAYIAIPLLLPNAPNALAFGVGGVAVASLAWPPVGGALGITALVASICAFPSRFAFPLALLMGMVGLVWWIGVGRRYHLSGTALLLPSCLSCPLAGVGIGGMALGPASAFFTGILGWVLWCLFGIGLRQGFEAQALAQELASALAQPATWVLMAGCGVGSLVCAALTRRGGTMFGILGQAAALAVLGFVYYACTQMENGGITSALDSMTLGITLCLGATLCIANILTGGYVQNLEGDDRT